MGDSAIGEVLETLVPPTERLSHRYNYQLFRGGQFTTDRFQKGVLDSRVPRGRLLGRITLGQRVWDWRFPQ
jgi:hypothetical protein